MSEYLMNQCIQIQKRHTLCETLYFITERFWNVDLLYLCNCAIDVQTCLEAKVVVFFPPVCDETLMEHVYMHKTSDVLMLLPLAVNVSGLFNMKTRPIVVLCMLTLY